MDSKKTQEDGSTHFSREGAKNPINAQIKLTEMWKAMNDCEHPFKIVKQNVDENERVSRSITNGVIKLNASTNVTQNTFKNDGIRAWN